MAAEGRLHTEARPVDDLVADVLGGSIRIPSFQRGLKWQRSDVIKLFDSIVRGYPIGNLLLWRRRAAAAPEMQIGALRIDASETDSALFVVDGQQRLTSLANALSVEGHADPRFALSYDVEKEEFVPTRGGSELHISLPTIFDLLRLLTYFSEHETLRTNPLFIERANRVAKAIREFRVPVYVVEQSDEAVLRDIFDRMNNYGRKLTRAEVFSALHDVGERERSDSAHDLSYISSQLHAATGYGLVDENTVLLAVLARRGANISRDIRREFEPALGGSDRPSLEFVEETSQASREATISAMVAAVSFLQESAGAPHFAFLPYRYILVVLTRFFAHFPNPAPGNIRNLRRWFWRAAILGPQVTKGNITSATRSLCDKIEPGKEWESISGLLDMVSVLPNADLEVTDFRTNYATTRIMVSAMWELGPRRISPDAGSSGAYTLDDLLESLGEQSTALQITPPVFDASELNGMSRSLSGNRVLLPESNLANFESLRDAMWRTSVDAYVEDERIASRVLESHAVDQELAQLLISGDAQSFVTKRQEKLTRVLRSFVSRNAEWDYEDTPDLSLLIVDDDRDDSLVDEK